MNITVNHKIKTPMYMQVAAQIKSAIIEGELLDGFTLPSERSLAKETGVHRNTVRRAYGELELGGLIEVRQGSGYRVALPRQNVGGARKVKSVNWASAIKDEYLDMEIDFDNCFSKSHEEGIISFAGGMTSPEIYGEEEIAGAMAEIISKGNKVMDFYTPYQGDLALRRQLATFMRGKGVKLNPGELQIFSESNQALDFIATLLLKPQDAVITEEPVSPDVYRAIRFAGGTVVAVPIDKDGMMCDNIEGLIEKHKPKLIYVNSSYNDPTGNILSLERREKLIELSYRYRLPIIEEDAASEIAFSGKRLPPLKALDKGNNVIYIYSFELTFVPGLRLAFVAGHGRIIKSLRNLVSVRLVNLEWITQKLLLNYFEKGIYMQKLELLRQEYREKRDLMCSWLEKAGPLGVDFQKPAGGVYIWCRLPDTIDGAGFAKLAAAGGVALVPGSVFYPEKNAGDNYIRLNYSYPSRMQIEKGMEILLSLLEKQLTTISKDNWHNKI